jgi:hypothetical protein
MGYAVPGSGWIALLLGLIGIAVVVGTTARMIHDVRKDLKQAADALASIDRRLAQLEGPSTGHATE